MDKLHIISYSANPFQDRTQAGKLLGEELTKLGYEGGVVLGIPRGGLVVAREIAREIEAELDIVISRKIGAPHNPEFAVGAISEDGRVFLDERSAAMTGANNSYIEQEKNRQLLEIQRRKKLIRAIKPKVSLEKKVVIVTDDGIATGATMQAALWIVRQERPEKVVVALPVGPRSTLAKLVSDADEVVCLQVPPFFDAVGQFYLNFTQVEDDEVLEILKTT